MSADKIAEEILSREEKARSERMYWNQAWQDVADLVLPRRSAFNRTITKGENVHDKIFDTTAVWANEQLAAGLHGFVTPATQRWLKLSVDDDELMDKDEVRFWLDAVADKVYTIIYQPETNFTPMSHEMYLDIGCLGTAIMYIEERQNKRAPIRFHTFHLGECCILENADGVVDTLYRRFKWSAKKIADRFPETCGQKMLEIAEKQPEQEFDLVHSVRPTMDGKKKALGFGFDSHYILCAEKRILSDGSFYEFPYATPRWSKIAGETYGRSPAMSALYDIRMINEMSKTVLKAAQKIVDPPLMMPDEGFLLPIKTTPGGINFYAAGSQDRIEPIQTGGDVGLGLEMMNQRREQILRAFFLDSMKLQKENKEMTAYETAQRTEENMRAMSPMVSRLQSEALGRIIERTIAILFRQNLLPPAPPEIQGMDYQINYISPVTRALKMTQLSGLGRMVQVLEPFVSVKPEMLDKINTDEIVDFASDQLDVPHKLLNTDAQVAQTRKARAEAEAQQNQMMEAQMAAEAANKGSSAAKNMAQVEAMKNGQ